MKIPPVLRVHTVEHDFWAHNVGANYVKTIVITMFHLSGSKMWTSKSSTLQKTRRLRSLGDLPTPSVPAPPVITLSRKYIHYLTSTQNSQQFVQYFLSKLFVWSLKAERLRSPTFNSYTSPPPYRSLHYPQH